MDELIPLGIQNLQSLPKEISVPSYDRASLKAGMVHIGLGNFHRAHQAWYLHQLFEMGLCHDWAIIGAGVREADRAQREKLQKQDWLTSLIELDPQSKSTQIIGSMIDYIPVQSNNAALIEQMTKPDIRIVSLTVTEGGYYIEPSNGGFDENHIDMIHDAENPREPRTAFGAMIEALRIRRDNGFGPFTGLSCDNLQGNGAILHRTIISLAKMSDPSLGEWIDQHCTFPNSMVDCIVPATGPAELEIIHQFGISDASPVTHENFRQWVIEDNFCAGRPDWDKVGATFSSDVHTYETMKLRILNGGHQLIAMPAELLGVKSISGSMSNPLIRQFLNCVVENEISAHVEPVPEIEPLQYLKLIEKRFSNPQIKDTTRRVAFDGSSRQPGFIFPSIRDGLKDSTSIDGLVLATAMWCKYCEGVREDGSIIEANDPNWSDLQKTAIAARNNPSLWFAQQQYYGDLSENPIFAECFTKWHSILTKQGVEVSIKTYLSSAGKEQTSAKTA